MNAHRLASKAAQIMQMRAGNSMAVIWRAWDRFVQGRRDQNKMAGIFGRKSLMKRMVENWKLKVGVGKLFKKCAIMLKFRAQGEFWSSPFTIHLLSERCFC